MIPTILVNDPALPLAHVAISSNLGALADPQGKEGATRLLLSLMRRSVRGLSPLDVEDTSDSLGASIGIELNRSVSGLEGSVLSRFKADFFALLAKMLLEPAFDESEFEKLRKEALAQWVETLDNDSVLAKKAFSRSLFATHPYGRLPSGTPRSLRQITLDDLRLLYEELFQERRLIASFAGDVSSKEAEDFARLVGSARSQETARSIDCPDPTVPSGRHLIFVDKPERSQTQILIGGLGTHPTDDDHTALALANTIFGGTFTSRLSQEVRAKRGWSYGASSQLPFDRRRSSFSMWTFPKSDDALSCIVLQLELLEGLIAKGVTNTELADAKRYIKNSHPFSIDTATKRASLIADQLLYQLPEDYYSGQVRRALAVRKDEVHLAVQGRLSSEDLVIAVVGTEKHLFERLKSGIPRLASARVVRYDADD